MLLAPMVALCTLGAYLSYDETLKQRSWFVWVMALLGALSAVIWGWACRLTTTKEQLYVYGLAWDVALLAVYLAFPLIVSGVRPSPGVLVGAALVAAGLIVVKVCG